MTAQAEMAFEAHDWAGVLDALDAQADLSADEHVLKGDALYWLGQYDESVGALEQAFASYLAEDAPDEAAKVACVLGYLGFRRQAYAVAGGWMSRAEHLLEGQPPSVGHVWLGLLRVGGALFGEGDVDTATQLVDDALNLATTLGTKSAESLALSFKAVGMVQGGMWREAMGIVDEATVMAMTLGDDLRMTSDVYCNTISLCRNLGDYKRAGEWTEQADRWMRENSVAGYTGACAVHRAELKRLRGSWQEAEDEARRACVGLEQFHLVDYVGLARYEIGEIRRRMGDLAVAEEEFQLAYENGHDAQPGMSLLIGDRGDLEEAYQSILGAMRRVPNDPATPSKSGTSRARLLPAFIDLAIRSGHLDEALTSVEDLEGLAEMFDSQVWKAAARSARGSLQLRSGDAIEAIDTLGVAWRLWAEVDLPYEMSRTRADLGEARRMAGDESGARMELKAALSTLERLGAKTEVSRVASLLGDAASVDSDATRVTRTFVFTDIETSTDLVELVGDEAWRDLLGWHDRTLRSAISSGGGEEVAHTGDGFFVAFAGAREAVETAVDIQRRLVRHRHDAGFAPKVRIGVHTAEATRQDGNYHGSGVHVAARVGALAAGEEIVISADVVEAAGRLPYPLGDPLSVELKGVTEPIEVRQVDWR